MGAYLPLEGGADPEYLDSGSLVSSGKITGSWIPPHTLLASWELGSSLLDVCLSAQATTDYGTLLPWGVGCLVLLLLNSQGDQSGDFMINRLHPIGQFFGISTHKTRIPPFR